MIPPEERIAAGRAVLALDTNAVKGFRRLGSLCNLVNRLREPPGPLELRICVPSIVHMEVLFDLRQDLGGKFDAQRVVQGLLDKGLEIEPFEVRHAEHAAEHLAAAFPQTKDWWAAKRSRCIECLGLKEHKLPLLGSGKKCNASIDFVLAAHAAHEGWILVTDDDDPEFAELELKVTLKRAEEILSGMVEQRSSPAGA